MTYKPYGVIGVISLWNYPFVIPLSAAVMAPLADNAVILKAASSVLNVGRELASVFAAAGLLADFSTLLKCPEKTRGQPLFRAALTNSFSPVPPPLDADSWLWRIRAFSRLYWNPAARTRLLFGPMPIWKRPSAA
jgi:hypothetical protein